MQLYPGKEWMARAGGTASGSGLIDDRVKIEGICVRFGLKKWNASRMRLFRRRSTCISKT